MMVGLVDYIARRVCEGLSDPLGFETSLNLP